MLMEVDVEALVAEEEVVEEATRDVVADAAVMVADAVDTDEDVEVAEVDADTVAVTAAVADTKEAGRTIKTTQTSLR